MKMLFVTSSKYFLALLLLILTNTLNAQPIFTSTLSGTPPPYNVPTGARIPAGNIVTIAPGAVVTFNYGLTIDSTAKLIVNGGTIKIGNGQKIILVQSLASATTTPISASPGAILQLNNGSVITSITSTPTGPLWQGIECKGPVSPNWPTGGPMLQIDGGTIQYATCAFSSFDPAIGADLGVGRIYAKNATFLNNKRSLDITRAWYSTGTSWDTMNWCANYVENSTFRLTADYPYTPNDMVNLGLYAVIVFRSCTFRAEPFIGAVNNMLNTNFAGNTTAINGNNSLLYVDRLIGNPNGCNFYGFKTGVAINNGLINYGVVVGNSTFSCVNNISLMGCYSAYVLGNSTYGPIGTIEGSSGTYANYCSVFLRNCRTYKVEGNNISYDIPTEPQGTNFAGIVAMNCGDSNNIVYRNTLNIPFVGVGISSIGTNRNAAGTAGMKILCNTIESTNFDIAVVRDSVPNPINGIHNLQYIPGMATDTSAGNTFAGTNVANPYRNYYLDPATNSASAFIYKYNPAFISENPVYRNFPNAITTTIANTCPPRKVRGPQPSQTLFAPGNIRLLLSGTDDANFQSAARPANNDQETATHTPPENTALLPLQQWLRQHNNNWASLPQEQKALVYEKERDPMSEGAAARSLLAVFEGRKYDPVILIPKLTIADKFQGLETGDKIYPNPASNKVFVDWQGQKGVLTLFNLSGQALLQQNILPGITSVDISILNPGTYIAEVRSEGNVTYQQKIVVTK